jgi:hypothetical protein
MRPILAGVTAAGAQHDVGKAKIRQLPPEQSKREGIVIGHQHLELFLFIRHGTPSSRQTISASTAISAGMNRSNALPNGRLTI